MSIKPVPVEEVIRVLHTTSRPSVFHVTKMRPGASYMLGKETDARMVDMEPIFDYPPEYLAAAYKSAMAEGKHLVIVDLVNSKTKVSDDLAPFIHRYYVDYFGATRK